MNSNVRTKAKSVLLMLLLVFQPTISVGFESVPGSDPEYTFEHTPEDNSATEVQALDALRVGAVTQPRMPDGRHLLTDLFLDEDESTCAVFGTPTCVFHSDCGGNQVGASNSLISEGTPTQVCSCILCRFVSILLSVAGGLTFLRNLVYQFL